LSYCSTYIPKVFGQSGLRGGQNHGLEEFAELFELYSLGFAAIFLFLGLMYFAASRKPATNVKEMRFWGRHFMIFTLMGLLSILLSVLGIGLQFGLPDLFTRFWGRCVSSTEGLVAI
jgi:uncharacterized membrane protein